VDILDRPCGDLYTELYPLLNAKERPPRGGLAEIRSRGFDPAIALLIAAVLFRLTTAFNQPINTVANRKEGKSSASDRSWDVFPGRRMCRIGLEGRIGWQRNKRRWHYGSHSKEKSREPILVKSWVARSSPVASLVGRYYLQHPLFL
jgi:hypothetical protein